MKLYQDIVTRLVSVPEISLAEVFITACAKGRLDLVADCLARGVEVNTVHATRWRWGVRGTALTLAAERNDAELLDLLLEQPGVDVNVQDKDGETPIVAAIQCNNEEIIRRLQQVPELILNDIFLASCVLNDIAKVEQCLGLGVDVNVRSSYQKAMIGPGLTIAAKKNYPELVELLLTQPRIEVNKPTSGGDTALILACRWGKGHPAIVRRLLKVVLSTNLREFHAARSDSASSAGTLNKNSIGI